MCDHFLLITHTVHTHTLYTHTFGHVKMLRQLQHFIESRVDVLFCFLQNVHQLSGLLGVLRSEIAIGSASLLSSCCAANAVDIILSVVGEIKIHHKLDIRHI